MKLKLYTLSFLLVSLVLYSCKSASKLYQQGRYDEAVAAAAKKLSKKPNDASQLDILQNAYRFAVQDHEGRIKGLTNSTSDLRWESIYGEYVDLQNLYEAIHRSPAVYDIVQPTDYSSFIATYQEQASNARFERGLELMDMGSKKNYQDAFAEFQKALSLKPGDLAIRQKMDEAYANGVTNIIVQAPTRFGYQYSSYNFDYNSFNYDMLRYLTSNNRSQFTRFYSPNQAANTVRVDQSVELKFSDVNIGHYRDERSVREVSRQIVAKEIVIKPDSIVKEYITVTARITTTTRTLRADGLLQASIRTANGRFVWSDTYRGDYNWVATFASYTGDDRALSDQDRRLVNQRPQYPPSNDEVIRIIMDDIQRKVQCGVSDYYNRVLY